MPKKETSEIKVKQQSQISLTPNSEMIEALKNRYNMFRQLQKDVLEENVDYGYPAGKKDASQKPSLYKSGAEKLTQLFNLIVDFQEIEAIENEKEVRYKFRCELHTLDGRLVGVGYGMASSFEKSHWKQNPLGNANTILKIAKKRSHVDAVLTGLGASNVFTQDIEDYEPEQINSQVSDVSDKQKELLGILIGRFAGRYNLTPPETEKRLEQLIGKPIIELNKQEMSMVINFLSISKLTQYKEIYEFLTKFILQYGFWKVLESNKTEIEQILHGKLTLDAFKQKVIKNLA